MTVSIQYWQILIICYYPSWHTSVSQSPANISPACMALKACSFQNSDHAQFPTQLMHCTRGHEQQWLCSCSEQHSAKLIESVHQAGCGYSMYTPIIWLRLYTRLSSLPYEFSRPIIVYSKLTIWGQTAESLRPEKWLLLPHSFPS